MLRPIQNGIFKIRIEFQQRQRLTYQRHSCGSIIYGVVCLLICSTSKRRAGASIKTTILNRTYECSTTMFPVNIF